MFYESELYICLMNEQLIAAFISLHREKFDSSDWQQRNWMRNELIEMNVPELEDYIEELRKAIEIDNRTTTEKQTT